MRFELAIAWRYFLSGRSQTLLTVSGVTVGVTVLIFISALVGGLRKTMIAQVLGTIAPIVVKPPRLMPRVLPPVEGVGRRVPGVGTVAGSAANPEAPQFATSPQTAPTPDTRHPTPELNLTTTLRFGREQERIRQWQRAEAVLRRLPGVAAVSPVAEGPAFAMRGTIRRPVMLRGVEPTQQNAIVSIETRMRRGTFDLSGENAVVGLDLARALGVSVGDKIRVTSSQLRTDTLTIVGIFDLGFASLNERWVFVARPRAQRVLDLGGSVTAIELQTRDLFAADRLADRVALLTGLRADSWSRADPEFLALLQVQSASSLLVQGFILAAVAFGIASVLVVAVLQRSRDIGILRSMGTRGDTIATIFLLKAGLVGMTGAILGTLLGVTLSLLLTQIRGHTAGGQRLFPIDLQMLDVLRAAGAAILSSLIAGFIPARRAASLDPVEVIHYG